MNTNIDSWNEMLVKIILFEIHVKYGKRTWHRNMAMRYLSRRILMNTVFFLSFTSELTSEIFNQYCREYKSLPGIIEPLSIRHLVVPYSESVII